MKMAILGILLVATVFLNPAYGHKLITHDGMNLDYDSALKIPDHKISWAIYEDLGADEAKFYTFDAKKGDSFYASIVIPNLSELEEFSPTLIIQNLEENFVKKVPYEGNYPSKEFYEPFGQVTYWERQEINLEIPNDGKYFIIVVDEKNEKGKYSLAIGTIEQFSAIDMITILPTAWLQTKFFVNDTSSILIFFSILVALISIPIFILKVKKQKLVQTN